MTRDELVSEEKKLKARKLLIALFMGALAGIAIWSATHGGSIFLTVILLIAVPLVGYSYQNDLKGVQMEISRRDTIR